LIAFDFETVRQAKARLPHLEVSWLVSSDKVTRTFPAVSEMIAKAKSAGLDGLDLNYGFPIDRAFVDQVHAAGLRLYVWTVDDPQKIKQLRETGVDGITTNRPKVALGRE
jgi:glycerophosphoryl diester phosphodiesterase